MRRLEAVVHRVLGAGVGSCPACQKVNNKVMSIKLAIRKQLLPVKGCSTRGGCQCFYARERLGLVLLVEFLARLPGRAWRRGGRYRLGVGAARGQGDEQGHNPEVLSAQRSRFWVHAPCITALYWGGCSAALHLFLLESPP